MSTIACVPSFTYLPVCLRLSFGGPITAAPSSADPQNPRQFCCGRMARREQWETLPLDKPSITPYLPAQNPTHTAIVVCPGGGYVTLAIDKEGTAGRSAG